MPVIDLVVTSDVSQSMRTRQVESLFDVPPQQKQTIRWEGVVPLEERPWNIGLIVGPSGCGKTTIAGKLFPDELSRNFEWTGASVIDDFPANMPLEEISAICQAVGFNTIPAWLRPFHVLSNGEQFRVTLARILAESRELAVVDEFTSVVDRQVAKIGSYAVQKYVRNRGGKFVAVSCHSDIIEWLNPDWVLEPATMTFSWRELQRRPPIECEIRRVPHRTWRLFAPFHYMSADLHPAAQCYALFIDGAPAAFAGVLYRPHDRVRNIWGFTRIVVLPDFQGLGLAFLLTETIASALKVLGQRCRTYPAHPAFVRSYDRSPLWSLEKRPGLSSSNRRSSRKKLIGRMGGRPNAVFEYVGPAMEDRELARQFLAIPSLSRAI